MANLHSGGLPPGSLSIIEQLSLSVLPTAQYRPSGEKAIQFGQPPTAILRDIFFVATA